MADKSLIWLDSSKDDLLDFSPEARRKAGFQLRAIQRGKPPADFKPMAIVGPGVEEIRIRADGAYRIFYIARFEEAIYILHCFQKKTQRTASQDSNSKFKNQEELARCLGGESANIKLIKACHPSKR